jgi:putative acetyltransferase
MKIEIRQSELDDYKALREIHAQPKVVRGTLQIPYTSAASWKKRLENRPDDFHSLVACVDEEIVGCVALWQQSRSPRRRHVFELGMSVHDDWQGMGVGTALMDAVIELADRWLNVLRLELTVFCDNEPAIRLYKKSGFEVEGTHRMYAFRDGRFEDALFMSRIREPGAAAS